MMNALHEYKNKIKHKISEYAQNVVDRDDAPLKAMVECYNMLDQVKCAAKPLNAEDIERWNESMVNEDGTIGGHWTLSQTNSVAESLGITFDHISDWCFNVAMNMMYSDYYSVAAKHGVNTPEFYGEMAKAFLFDKDAEGPKEKLAAYYRHIAEE